MASTKEITIEDKLRALYDLQIIDKHIDRIRAMRGELPLEVEDLEDEIAGLQIRSDKFQEEIGGIDAEIKNKKILIKDAEEKIAKYEAQQKNVRNNREFDAISKEIEYQGLEIELANKRIKEHKATIENKNTVIATSDEKLAERKSHLDFKKSELDNILKETQKEEDFLLGKSEEFGEKIEERLLTAYKRIRSKVVNGLAVVSVEREACGGCFSQIPPQRQLDIQMHKRVIVCEHCGRVMVDANIFESQNA